MRWSYWDEQPDYQVGIIAVGCDIVRSIDHWHHPQIVVDIVAVVGAVGDTAGVGVAIMHVVHGVVVGACYYNGLVGVGQVVQ